MTRDAQPTLVIDAVMLVAQCDQIVGIRGAVMGPVNDVMNVEPALVVAAGDSATAVAVDDRAPGSCRTVCCERPTEMGMPSTSMTSDRIESQVMYSATASVMPQPVALVVVPSWCR